MGSRIEFKRHLEKRQAPQSEIRSARRQDFRSSALKARLQDVSERLPNLDVDPEFMPRESGVQAFGPAFDLCAKVDAVRWMLRVAKHVQDPARERILLRANSTLDQLERAVNHRLDAA
jgi:hypothetical protein